MRAALVVRKSHDVLGLFFLGLGLEVSGASGDEFGVFSEERDHIEIRVIEDRVLAILGIDGSQVCFILAIWLQYLDNRLVFVVKDVLGQLRVRRRELWEISHDCGGMMISKFVVGVR